VGDGRRTDGIDSARCSISALRARFTFASLASQHDDDDVSTGISKVMRKDTFLTQ
jgi:hypothetical protein